MDEICASKDGDFLKCIFFLKFFIPIISSIFDVLNIGPLCLSKPSKVSTVKFKPLNFRYLFF